MAASSSSPLLFPSVLWWISDGGIPEHCGGLSGSSGAGWGGVWRRLLPLPAGQDGHTVLLTQILLRPLTSFDLSTQNPFLLDHLHHGGISTEPRHLENDGKINTDPQPLPVCHSTYCRVVFCVKVARQSRTRKFKSFLCWASEEPLFFFGPLRHRVCISMFHKPCHQCFLPETTEQPVVVV